MSAERQHAVEALAARLPADLCVLHEHEGDVPPEPVNPVELVDYVLHWAEQAGVVVPKAELDAVTQDRDEYKMAADVEAGLFNEPQAKLKGSASKGLYQAQVEAQRAELDVALRERAEAERERDEQATNLVDERDHWIRLYGRLETAVRRHIEAKEATWADDADDALRAAHRSVTRESTLPRAALARETSPAETGE